MLWLVALAFILWGIVTAYGWAAGALAALFALVGLLGLLDTFGDKPTDPRERRS